MRKIKYIFPFLPLLLLINFSVGDRYFNRLSLWYRYAQNNQWSKALPLESKINPVDIAQYKKTHYPPELKKSINSLEVKPNKTPEDFLELARVNSILGKSQASIDAIKQAKTLDPLRDDISQLYYQTIK